MPSLALAQEIDVGHFLRARSILFHHRAGSNLRSRSRRQLPSEPRLRSQVATDDPIAVSERQWPQQLHRLHVGGLAWDAGYAGGGRIVTDYDKRWLLEMEKSFEKT